MSEMSLGRLFWEIEARTEKLVAGLARARQQAENVTAKPIAVPVTADTKPMTKAIDTATAKVKTAAPVVVSVTADTKKAETEFERFKKRIRNQAGGNAKTDAEIQIDFDLRKAEKKLQTLRGDVADLKEVVGSDKLRAKLDLDIAKWEEKVARARIAIETLGSGSPKGRAAIARARTVLAGVADGVEQSYGKIDKAFGRTEQTVVDKTKGMSDAIRKAGNAFQNTGGSVMMNARAIANAMVTPAAAVGLMAAAFAKLEHEAFQAASAMDSSMRAIRSQLPDTNTNLGELQEHIEGLSTVSPRTAKELGGVALELARLGESDPAEIARDLDTLALAGDALAASDLRGMVGTLDLLADAFGLTAEQARNAFVQIASMTRGKIDFNEFSGVLDRSAASMTALRISAQETAAAVTTLIDAGVQRRKVGSALPSLLDSAATAPQEALNAELAGNDAKAKSLRILASSISASSVESKGLVLALGDLFRALGGTRDGFTRAGLSADAFTLASKAAERTADGQRVQVDTLAESLRKLNDAALTNRDSAEALSQRLKNELDVALTNLGNVTLPFIITKLERMVALFASGVPGAVLKTRDAIKQLEEANNRPQGATLGSRAGIIRTDQEGLRMQALKKIQEQSRETGGRSLENLDMEDLKRLVLALEKGQIRDAELLGKAMELYNNKQLQSELNAQNKPGDKTETPMADPDMLKRMEEQLKSLRNAARSMKDEANEVGPIEKFKRSIEEWADSARKAKMSTTEIEAEVKSLNEALSVLRTNAVRDIGFELQELQASLTTTAVDDMTVAMQRQVVALRARAAAARDAGDTGLAKRIEEEIGAFEKHEQDMRNATVAVELYTQAMQDAERSPKTFLGDVFSAAQVQHARDQLKAIRAQLTDKAAIALVDEKIFEIESRLKAVRDASFVPPKKFADTLLEAAKGMETMFMFASGLQQTFGDSDAKLTRMLTSATSMVSAFRAIAEKAKEAGGYSKLFSSAEGISSVAGPIMSIIGNIQDIYEINTKDTPEDKAARELLRANNDALLVLTRRIGDLANASFTARAFNEVQKGIEALFDARSKVDLSILGVKFKGAYNNKSLDDPSLPDTFKADFSAFLTSAGATMQDVEDIAAGLGITMDGTLGSYRALRKAMIEADFASMTRDLQSIASTFSLLNKINRITDPIALLADQFSQIALLSPKIGGALDAATLATEEGRQAAREFVAGIVRGLFEGNREAYDMLGDVSIQDFLGWASLFIDGIDAITDSVQSGAEKLGPMLDRIEEKRRLFLTTAEATLGDVVQAYVSAFPTLAAIFNTQALATAADRDGAIKSLQDFYTMLIADGVQDGEQALIDAILAIVDALRDASDEIESAVDVLIEKGRKLSEAFTKERDRLDDKTRFETGYGDKADPSKRVRNLIDAADKSGSGINFRDLLNGDTNTKAGLLSNRKKISDLYAELAADGIDESEKAIVEILDQLMTAIDAALDGMADDAEQIADKEETRKDEARRREQQRRNDTETLIRARDIKGLDAFKLRYISLAQAFPLGSLNNLFGALTGPDGLPALKTGLQDMLQAVLAGTFPLELLGDMTKEDFIDSLLGLLDGLDDLGDSFDELAEKAKRNAEDIEDFGDAADEATGQDVRLRRFDRETARKKKEFEDANKGDAYITAYLRMRGAQRDQLMGQIADELAQAIEEASRQAAEDNAASPETRKSEYVASNVTAITQQQALRLSDYAASQLVEQRGINAGIQQLVRLAMGGTTGYPTLTAPTLPPSPGMSSQAMGGFTLVVNINGPIMGMTPQEAGQQLADAAFPYINAKLARSAGLEATNAGRTLS